MRMRVHYPPTPAASIVCRIVHCFHYIFLRVLVGLRSLCIVHDILCTNISTDSTLVLLRVSVLQSHRNKRLLLQIRSKSFIADKLQNRLSCSA